MQLEPSRRWIVAEYKKKLINFLYLEKFYVTKMEGVITKILNRTYLPLFEISSKK